MKLVIEVKEPAIQRGDKISDSLDMGMCYIVNEFVLSLPYFFICSCKLMFTTFDIIPGIKAQE